MKIQSNKINRVCLFHDKNQWDEKLTRMMCSFYAPMINAKYNWAIKDFTESDIKAIAEIQIKAWKFSTTLWGKWEDGVLAVQKYLKDVKWIETTLITLENDVEAKEWIDRWFAVLLWIKVNNLFFPDSKDWRIDEIEYSKLKWNIGHFTNMIKWNCRWTDDCSDKWKEFILDSYFIKSSIYEVNHKELLEDLDMPTKYLLI